MPDQPTAITSDLAEEVSVVSDDVLVRDAALTFWCEGDACQAALNGADAEAQAKARQCSANAAVYRSEFKRRKRSDLLMKANAKARGG